jgi:hypothetical protein
VRRENNKKTPTPTTIIMDQGENKCMEVTQILQKETHIEISQELPRINKILIPLSQKTREEKAMVGRAISNPNSKIHIKEAIDS